MAQNKQMGHNLKSLEIYAFSSADKIIDWGETSKLFTSYHNKEETFEFQDKAFKEAFDTHIEKFGFSNFQWYRYLYEE